ncbi:MAG: delta-60 repeat domain-containing protein [Flavobacteriales bacterium]|nr:delta-60 repeat domain-containing protein [Flavobacteriales bacterium]
MAHNWGNIVRLTPDGLVDGTFQTGSGFSGTVRTIELDPAGGCFVGGGSSQYNGVAIGLLVRLNDNGSLDATYPAGAGPNGEVRTMLMQPDGKLIIGGTFTSVNGTPRARIARLLADGSLDVAFDPGSGANGSVDALALQSDGSILIGGAFTDVNGTPLNRIARLTSAGAVDATFLIGTGANAGVLGLAIQSDGNILLNGDFTSINGVSRSRIARLNASGGLDATFFPTGTSGGNILTMKLLQSGKVMIGGSFLSVGGTSRNRIARLENNGSVDATFDPGMGVGGWVRAMDELSDGRILVGGQFTTYAGVWRSRLTRITGAAALDLTFNPGSGSVGGVGVMVPQPDGRVLIGGTFTLYNGEVRFRVARINADGSLDSSFDPGIGPSTEGDIVSALAVQSDGKVLVGGTFLNWSGVSHRRLVRLMPDGTLDPSFTTGTGPNSQVQSFALRPDGRILIGGLFTAYDGVNSSRIASLNADGSLDPTFDPGTGFNGSVTDVILLPDGKILVSGFFTDYNGTTVGRLARLNADGSQPSMHHSTRTVQARVRPLLHCRSCYRPMTAS